jgi:hypothetical protein
VHSPDHPRRSFLALGLAGDAGVILRLDVANGNEGFQTQLFLNYSWGLFN